MDEEKRTIVKQLIKEVEELDKMLEDNIVKTEELRVAKKARHEKFQEKFDSVKVKK